MWETSGGFEEDEISGYYSPTVASNRVAIFLKKKSLFRRKKKLKFHLGMLFCWKGDFFRDSHA